MSEWTKESLGSLVTFQKGRKVETSDFQKAGFAPYLGAGSLTGEHDNYADTAFAIKANENDILMLWDGERSGLVGHKLNGVVSSTVSKLTPHTKIGSDYLYYYLLFNFEWIQGRRTGTGVPHVPKDLARILEVSYPECKRIQFKISSILSAIDTAIEKTESLIAKYQKIKAGLMHDLFTRGVTADGKLRPPREQVPELYQETPIGWIPKEWDTAMIGEVFNIQLGKMLNQRAKTGKSSFPYLGNKNVQWNRVDIYDLEEMDFSVSERNKFSLEFDDLLVCEGGDVGRTAIWDSPIENCFFQKAIHRLRPKGCAVKPRYMLRYMWFAKNYSLLTDFTSQSSIAHLTQEKLSKVPVVIPGLDEQDRLISRFEGIDFLLSRQFDTLAKLQNQKLGLMQDLLTGKVPVKIDEPDQESA